MSSTIFQRALEFVADGMTLGLGSGRAANRFTELVGERVKQGLRVRGVPTSQATADLAARVGVPLVSLDEALTLDLTVDGADEVDGDLNLIKGYGRALVREKIVAAASKSLVILVGREKLVARLGERGKLPIEVVPFGAASIVHRLRQLGLTGVLQRVDGRPFVSDNGNLIIDVEITPLADAEALERRIGALPGVVDTGMFLGMADVVLVGESETFQLTDELRRPRFPAAAGS